MTPVIRPIAPDDWPGWCRLWQGYLSYYETTLPEAQYQLQFDRLTDPAQTGITGFLAVGDQAGPVGLTHCIWHPHGWTADPVVYLQDLFTAPEARGQGVARALIETVYAHADAGGAASVYWMTQHFNATARALYDRVGQLTPFVKYERPK